MWRLFPSHQKKEIKCRKRLHLSCMAGDNLLCSCCLSKINDVDLGITSVHLRLSIISRKSSSNKLPTAVF
jgi:hypothetical protein